MTHLRGRALLRGLALALLLAGSALSGTAQARPASVVGNYIMRLDNDQLKLAIFSQANTGTCQRIVGSLKRYTSGAIVGAMTGWYCPATGRIGYQILKPADGSTLQSFSGAVSGAGSLFAGTVSIFGDGLRGEYNVAAGR